VCRSVCCAMANGVVGDEITEPECVDRIIGIGRRVAACLSLEPDRYWRLRSPAPQSKTRLPSADRGDELHLWLTPPEATCGNCVRGLTRVEWADDLCLADGETRWG